MTFRIIYETDEPKPYKTLELPRQYSDEIISEHHQSRTPLIRPIKETVFRDKQELLKDLYSVDDLCINTDAHLELGRRIREYYPHGMCCVRRWDIAPRLPEPNFHLLTDDELVWLMGESVWMSTGARAEVGQLAKAECRAYRVFFRRGTILSEDGIKMCYPRSYPLMGRQDFNLLEDAKAYSYALAENDYELHRFLASRPWQCDGLALSDDYALAQELEIYDHYRRNVDGKKSD